MDQRVMTPDASVIADVEVDATAPAAVRDPMHADLPTSRQVDGRSMPGPADAAPRVHQPGIVVLEPTLPDEIVPVSARTTTTATTAPLPRASAAQVRAAAPLPELTSLRVPGIAWIVGRAMISLAIAGAGHLMRSMADGGTSLMSAPPELAILGALALAGLASMASYSAIVAGDARRLQLLTPRPRTAATVWLLPLAWVVCGTGLMTIDVRAEVDPMPGIAVVGLALALGVPYLVAGDVTRPLGRGRAVGPWWLAMYVADVAAIGIAWCAFVAYAHEGPTATGTWRAMEVGALVSIVPVLIAVVIAARIPRLFRARLDDLEHRWTSAADPTWFRTGFGGRSVGRAPVAVLGSTWSRYAATAALAAWAGAVSLAAAVACAPLWFGATAPDPYPRVLSVAAMAAGGVFTIAFGVWSTIAVVNARRIRPVGAVTPSLPIVLAVPVPAALAVAASIGGDLGWAIAAATIAGGCALGMIGLRMLGSIATDVRASAPLFTAWVLVMALAAIAFGGGYAALGPVPAPWTELGVRHVFVGAQVVILGVAAVLGQRAMSSLDERLAARAG